MNIFLYLFGQSCLDVHISDMSDMFSNKNHHQWQIGPIVVQLLPAQYPHSECQVSVFWHGYPHGVVSVDPLTVPLIILTHPLPIITARYPCHLSINSWAGSPYTLDTDYVSAKLRIWCFDGGLPLQNLSQILINPLVFFLWKLIQ